MKKTILFIIAFSILSLAGTVNALGKDSSHDTAADENAMEGMDHGEMSGHEHHHPTGPSDCSDMEVFEYSMGMCMPLAMKGMPMSMLMVHGNAFATQLWEEGSRGRNAFAAPNMFMADIGTSVGDRQYINLDF